MADAVTDREIVVADQLSPIRLDVWLTKHTDLSRTNIQKHIKAGDILWNGKKVVPHHHVHNGDIIALPNLDTVVHERAKPITPVDPTILFEDDNYLVVNKPSGLIVHGGPGIHEYTLADWAVAHDPKIAEVGDQAELRPGIVHRLDRDVSGVMVIAKTADAFFDLKRQFQNHTISKQYTALVYNRLTDQHGRITFAIARKADKSGLMVARPNSTEGKSAETRFTVERFVKNMSLIKVTTLTGRSHQIRVHFKAIGHPLVGDPLYKIRKLKVTKITPPRIFLHATKLGFDGLDGTRHEFQADLPIDLQRFLAKVG